MVSASHPRVRLSLCGIRYVIKIYWSTPVNINRHRANDAGTTPVKHSIDTLTPLPLIACDRQSLFFHHKFQHRSSRRRRSFKIWSSRHRHISDVDQASCPEVGGVRVYIDRCIRSGKRHYPHLTIIRHMCTKSYCDPISPSLWFWKSNFWSEELLVAGRRISI